MFNSKILTSLLISCGLISFFSTPIFAQAINEKEPNPFQSNEQNPLYGDGINPMDLIHNANLLNNRSAYDFQEDTNNNINKAADDFKKQQLERMQQLQQQSNPNSNGVTNKQ